MRTNSLSDWLQYIEFLPSGLNNRSLEHIKSVAKKLGVLNFTGKIITVAGTNGKSSCVVFLESILLAVGYKTATYISPHVLHYNERIRLDGKEIDDVVLCQAFALVELARSEVALSCFEFGTLAALTIFKQQQPDFLILEVGLGGRFDAVNILDGDISIITTISFDHMQILGNTREAIGYEKAGIMRHLKPVILGPDMPESVYAAAAKIRAKICNSRVGAGFSLRCLDTQAKACGYQLQLPTLSADLALMAIDLLSVDYKIPQQAIARGLSHAFLLGRWQKVLFNKSEIIFDVAHNPESAALLVVNLTKNPIQGRTLAVVSMLGDKDITATLKPFKKSIDRWYVGIVDNVRAASASKLESCLQEAGILNFTLLPTIATSLRQAIAECQENDRIVVFGSFHTVEEGLVYLKKLSEKNYESRK